MKNFWKKLNKPFKVLAPMAGYTDSAFRLLCRELGADVVVSELVSADAIYHQSKYWYKDEEGIWRSKRGKDETLEMLKFDEAERPYVVQLFGKYPEKFAFAAKWVSENLKPDGIDINMGCPARKVVNSDHGAALLKNSELAVEIVKAVKENTDLPVSVKTRLGWDHDDQILEFAPLLLHAGIDALTIHGRTYKDAFKGAARWDNIYEVKKMFGDKLIVTGNGDISSYEQLSTLAKEPYGETQLDGLMVGRAAFGKPWIFSKESMTNDELKSIILKQARYMLKIKGDFGMIEFRKHLVKYIAGFAGAKDLRKKAVTVASYEDVQTLVAEL